MLETSLVGTTGVNVAADALGMLLILVLWRRVLLQNQDLI